VVSQGASLEVSACLHRVSWLLHARIVEAKLRDRQRAVKAGFDPNQPRVPAGNRDGGQWTSIGVGSRSPISESRPNAQAVARPRSGVQLAGGFTDEQMELTVQNFASTHCRGLIHRMLPGQFLGMTIADVMAAAKGGDPAARTCLKLLKRDDYRK
jgi:hypothetical protein